MGIERVLLLMFLSGILLGFTSCFVALVMPLKKAHRQMMFYAGITGRTGKAEMGPPRARQSSDQTPG